MTHVTFPITSRKALDKAIKEYLEANPSEGGSSSLGAIYTVSDAASFTADDPTITTYLVDSTGDVEFVISENLNVLPINAKIEIRQIGDGVANVVSGGGVTIAHQGMGIVTDGMFNPITLLKISAENWIATGGA